MAPPGSVSANYSREGGCRRHPCAAPSGPNPMSGMLIGAARHAISCPVTQQHLIDTRPERALVLFSGGQDSTPCLAWALARFAAVETIGFDYRQRHQVELECRASVIERLRGE